MRERERTSVSRTDDGDSDSLSGRRGSRYPDSHQLFVGNLPHNITERELRTYFESKYFYHKFVSKNSWKHLLMRLPQVLLNVTQQIAIFHMVFQVKLL